MISKKMKYALKALIEIANNKEEHISASHIAEKANVPIKFLEQILTELRKGHIVNSKKGSFGGYYLLKTPQNITIADIYRLIDGPIAWVPCASLNFYETCKDCPNEATCNIHHALVYLRNETLRVLQKMTIEDLAMGKFNFEGNNWSI
jgi:Rrf2 family protein